MPENQDEKQKLPPGVAFAAIMAAVKALPGAVKFELGKELRDIDDMHGVPEIVKKGFATAGFATGNAVFNHLRSFYNKVHDGRIQIDELDDDLTDEQLEAVGKCREYLDKYRSQTFTPEEIDAVNATKRLSIVKKEADAANLASLYAKKAVTPEEVASLRRRIYNIVDRRLGKAAGFLDGTVDWNANQVRMFGLLLDRVMPKLNHTFNEVNINSKPAHELTREELERIVLEGGGAAANLKGAIIDAEFEEIEQDRAGNKSMAHFLAKQATMDQHEREAIDRALRIEADKRARTLRKESGTDPRNPQRNTMNALLRKHNGDEAAAQAEFDAIYAHARTLGGKAGAIRYANQAPARRERAMRTVEHLAESLHKSEYRAAKALRSHYGHKTVAQMRKELAARKRQQEREENPNLYGENKGMRLREWRETNLSLENPDENPSQD